MAPASELADGEKIAVQFENTRVLVLRDGDELRAFSALCPHQGYHLDDGHHDKAVLTCPGHGLEFDTKTGRSKLDRFKLRTFDVFERDGQIFLK